MVTMGCNKSLSLSLSLREHEEACFKLVHLVLNGYKRLGPFFLSPTPDDCEVLAIHRLPRKEFKDIGELSELAIGVKI